MTTTDDLIVRAQAVLDAAEKMTPGPWKARGVMIDPEIACIPHRPSMYTLGRTDESTPADDARADTDATGIAILRNAAPAVIRDLIARLADQAPGLTVGAALADPRVRSGEFIVEYDRPRVQKVEQMGWYRNGLDADFRVRSRHTDEPWDEWRNNDRGVWPGTLDIRCRLVPLADADRNPAERGPL